MANLTQYTLTIAKTSSPDVTIDVFTKTEYDPIIEQLQQAFNDRGIPFGSYPSNEDDTGYIHYEYNTGGDLMARMEIEV